jgi:hypothetical protein
LGGNLSIPQIIYIKQHYATILCLPLPTQVQKYTILAIEPDVTQIIKKTDIWFAMALSDSDESGNTLMLESLLIDDKGDFEALWFNQVSDKLYTFGENQKLNTAMVICSGVKFLPQWDQTEEVFFKLITPIKQIGQIHKQSGVIIQHMSSPVKKTSVHTTPIPLFYWTDKEIITAYSHVFKDKSS